METGDTEVVETTTMDLEEATMMDTEGDSEEEAGLSESMEYGIFSFFS